MIPPETDALPEPAAPVMQGVRVIEDGGGHPAPLAGRLPDARCQGRRALRRQGARAQASGRGLHAVRPPAGTAPAHGARDAARRGHHHRQRGRGAAAGGEPHQAAAAALQHRPPRRQILSLAGADGGPPLPADRQAPGRAAQGRELLGAVRLRLGGEPDADRPAARVPAPLLPRHGVRQPRRGPACCTRSAAARRLAWSASARTDYAELVRQAKAIPVRRDALHPEGPRPRDGGRRPSGWSSSAPPRCATASAA